LSNRDTADENRRYGGSVQLRLPGGNGLNRLAGALDFRVFPAKLA